jgi:adenosine deaminase
MTAPDSPDFFHALPKVDLHRHLEGSVRLKTLLEVGRTHGISFPNTGRLRELVQVGDEDNLTFENFLSKFATLRLFYRSPEVIHRITTETIADAAADNVRYLELRFTPIALSRAENFPLDEVIQWVVDAAEAASRQYGIQTRLIVSVNRQEGPEIAQDVIRAAVDFMGRNVVGVDLAGNEASVSGLGFLGVFKEAQQAGLKVTIHAGEWGSAENVMNAILYLSADRIGHGVRVIEDPQVVTLARERGIPFEVCITSNYQSGVVSSLAVHPLARMLALGLNVTLNTDDPSVSQITLTDEYRLACQDLGLSIETLRSRVLAAAQASFLPQPEKDRLAGSLAAAFPQTA